MKFSKIPLLAVISTMLLAGLWTNTVYAAGEGFWSTKGSRLIDEQGQTVVINGVNWFGLETESMAPHGLWSRNYKEMMNQIKSLGFNTIRLPYSNQALEGGAQASGIDYGQNSDLVGLRPIEIMDKVVEYAGQIGLKIILDRHRPEAWGQSELWYTGVVPESRWINDWQMLARRYANNPTVIGADLHNEPHGSACWGCGNPATDWKEAATRAGNAILQINPNWLVIVEGVEQQNNQWYWWGGNLGRVGQNQIQLNVANKLVYSTHDYPNSVHSQSWLNQPNFPDNLPEVWDGMWGYLVKNNVAPVLVGEFGTKLETESDKKWLAKLVDYMKSNGISWTYWCFNPNSGDTGGILEDDWQRIREDKMAYIRPAMGSTTNVTMPLLTPTQPVPTPTFQESLDGGVKISYQIREQWNNGYVMDMTVENNTALELADWKVEWPKTGNQNIGEHWGIAVTQGTDWVNARGDAWNKSLPAGAKATFGMVVHYQGSYVPFGNFKVVTAYGSTPTPAPEVSTPSPTPSGSISDTTNQINVWWPVENMAVAGIQPIKAVLETVEVNNYQMNWRVDGGGWNSMDTNLVDEPHKEALIDFSGWNWRGNGPYRMEVEAKNSNGQVVATKLFNLMVSK